MGGVQSPEDQYGDQHPQLRLAQAVSPFLDCDEITDQIVGRVSAVRSDEVVGVGVQHRQATLDPLPLLTDLPGEGQSQVARGLVDLVVVGLFAPKKVPDRRDRKRGGEG